MTQSNPVLNSINAIMQDIKKLEKTDTNEFAKYNYVDIDTFLEALNPLCAKHGLIISTSEVSCDVIGDAKKWLHIVYEFTLSHKDGFVWDKIFTRNQFVPFTGGQAMGSAQSYTLKQFMRGLFQIPTGDKVDVDGDENTRFDGSKTSRKDNYNSNGISNTKKKTFNHETNKDTTI
tara:strand:+ start:20414 stop:20938 length:525 start_codon:yes stop_codon:yes gene_type:complete